VTYNGPIRVHDETDGETPSFDEDETPFLAWGRHPKHGNCWRLWYLDETGEVDDHVIAGDITDQDWATEQARHWLGLVGHSH
jgi:hypothetical protein